MRNLIINADDCGRNHVVNEAINSFIENGVLTSTTVMANMEDFEGAVNIYNKFSDIISFGAHLNLTQGSPLTDPTIFLKYGFCKGIDGRVLFNGMPFRWKYMNNELRKAAYLELDAQVKKLKSAGICISHIDSHQHIHFAPCLTPVFATIAKDNGILRIRRPKNFLHYNAHDIAMRGLNAYYMYQLRHLKTTYFFSSAEAYINWPKKIDATYELMCHPGHENPKYQKEMIILNSYLGDTPGECLISYRDL